jgi:N-acyl amino acid synthase of PEP-CTERM/exosortase system
MLLHFSPLGTAMDEKFSFRKLSSPGYLQEAYRLRFQVYCRECNFIKESDHPEGLETDGFDEYSAHFGAFDLQGRMVGGVRLILPASPRFPIEEHCSSLEIDRNQILRQTCAEVSRLTISKLYRRRAQDGLYYEAKVEDKHGEEGGSSLVRRIRPMAFGLYRAMYHESKRGGIRYWLALMEKGLWKLLHIHGFVFHPIGPEVDFFGVARPYIGDLLDLETKIFVKFPKFFEYFMLGLEPELKPELLSGR